MKTDDLADLLYGLVITSKKTRKTVPLKDINIDAQIKGFIANVDTALQYRNEDTKAVEAEFIFPVDDNCAVYRFEAEIEGKTIISECQPKSDARQTYNDAKRRGHTAFLLEEDDRVSDIFKMKVGNLPPDTNVTIRFSYVIELSLSAEGCVAFVVPSVLVPRYGGDINSEPFEYKQEGLVVQSGDSSYRLAFTATVEGNSPIEKVKSPGDSLRALNLDANSKVVKVVLGKPLSRKHDTRMEIVYKESFKPQIHWAVGDREKGGMLKQDVLMLNFLPELKDTDFSSKQEFIFIIDRSGSMSGSNIRNAKETLLLFLKSLPAECYFNIVSFGSDFKFLFKGGSVEYNEENLATAEKCQRRMSADMGGTEIYDALKQIYGRPPFMGFARQLFLITDGEVYDTNNVIQLVKKNSTNTRLFSIGIGEGASTALIRGTARAGRGQAEFVTGKDRLQTKVMKILKQAMQTSVQELSLDWSAVNFGEDAASAARGKAPTVIPQPIPPIFHGNRLILYAIFEDLTTSPSGTCMLKGLIDGQEIKFNLDLNTMEKVNDKHLAIHRLAAKAQIKYLEDEMKEESDRDKVTKLKSMITMLSTSANVVSSQTAFVGFDKDSKVVEMEAEVDLMESTASSPCVKEASHQNLVLGPGAVPVLSSRCASFEEECEEDCEEENESDDDVDMMAQARCKRRRSRSRSRDRDRHRRRRSRSRSRSPERRIGFSGGRGGRGGGARYMMKTKGSSRSRSRSRSRGSSSSSSSRSRSRSSSNRGHAGRGVLDIMKLQKFGGNWELNAELCSILGKDMKSIEDASPVKDMKVWATALALVWLKVNFMVHHDEWEMIEMKATRWLQKQTLEGSTQQELMAAAETLGLSMQTA